MFGYRKKLREMKEEIAKLEEKARVSDIRGIAAKEAYIGAENALKTAKDEAEKWKLKYSNVFEKYLTLLEKYEKALKGVNYGSSKAD